MYYNNYTTLNILYIFTNYAHYVPRCIFKLFIYVTFTRYYILLRINLLFHMVFDG